MICCLLALCAALPGVSLIRRLSARPAGALHCGSLRMVSRRHDIAVGMSCAVIVVAVFATAMTLHRLNHDISAQAFAPICSALDRLGAR
jgi:hypothetical protein